MLKFKLSKLIPTPITATMVTTSAEVLPSPTCDIFYALIGTRVGGKFFSTHNSIQLGSGRSTFMTSAGLRTTLRTNVGVIFPFSTGDILMK